LLDQYRHGAGGTGRTHTFLDTNGLARSAVLHLLPSQFESLIPSAANCLREIVISIHAGLLGTALSRNRFLRMKKPLAPRPDAPPGLTPALERNIHALVERQRREQSEASIQQKVADAVTAFTGSMAFVYLHLIFFGIWIAADLRWVPGIPPWDQSFVVLAMFASVEAIFLSTFVLISQNRMGAAADKRADLDLQISLHGT
jgi:uncharacterized protein DUF1003